MLGKFVISHNFVVMSQTCSILRHSFVPSTGFDLRFVAAFHRTSECDINRKAAGLVFSL